MTTSGAFIRTIIRGGSPARRWSNEELDCYADVLRQPAPTPRMTIEVIEGAGHFLPEEAPDAVLRHITGFLAPGGH